MGRYIVVPVPRDPEDAIEKSREVVRGQFPSWQPRPADPMDVFLRSVAVLYADVAELATRMGEEVFRFYGRGVAGLPPTEARAASAVVEFEAVDTAGPYVVPEGTEVTGTGSMGEPVAFRTIAAVVIPNGETTVEADAEALDEGEGSNGVSGSAELVEFFDYLAPVATFVGTSGGGVDREGDAPFLDRLGDELELLTPRPILPRDFEVLARRFGAYRATALDGYDPGDASSGNPAMVTLAMVDELGEELDSLLFAQIGEAIDGMREVGFAVHTVAPTYTTVRATWTGTAYPGWDPDDVEAAGNAAVAAFLSPGEWGARDDTGEVREWINEPTVRWGEVYERLQRVEGLRYVDTLGIAVEGNAVGATGVNVVMTGVAPLPRPGTILGTVAAG